MCSGHIQHNFSCCDDFSKFGKEYLNSLKCQFCTFLSIKLRKLGHTARLSRTNRHKVIKSETQSVFWPTLYIICIKYSVKIRRVFPEICSRTDRQTDRHGHHNILAPLYRGRSNNTHSRCRPSHCSCPNQAYLYSLARRVPGVHMSRDGAETPIASL